MMNKSSRSAAGDEHNFFLIEDLEDSHRMKKLAVGDPVALHAIADWIWNFIARPHKNLGRPGPVCPFVPEALERRTLWLASQRIGDLDPLKFSQRIEDYKRAFLSTQSGADDDTRFKSLVVVLPDLPADRAKEFFGHVLEQLAIPSYSQDGLMLGAFYERNAGTAIHNPDFRPFAPPVPFLLMRHAVISDWKFFLDNDDWLALWARRYGPSAVQALAEELRRLSWRETREPASARAELDQTATPGR